MAKRGFRVNPNTPFAERVMYHVAVDIETRCWNWLGAIDAGTGYAMLFGEGKTRKGHRVSYEAFVGPIPDGLQIDHLCRNRGCVNPAHLEPVTPLENTRRSNSTGAVARRRTHCRAGHDFATHGVMRAGRRICRTCKNDYLRQYHARRRAERQAYWTARGFAA